MRGRRWYLFLLCALVGLPSVSAADLFSKSYEFRQGITLEVGAQGPAGLRLDSVRFRLPARAGTRPTRTGGSTSAEVAVSNTRPEPLKVGVAIALYDENGRLLGVASGGTKLLPLKPDRQRTYTLVFDHVNDRAFEASTFQISLEAR